MTLLPAALAAAVLIAGLLAAPPPARAGYDEGYMLRFLNEEAVRCERASRSGKPWAPLMPMMRFCPVDMGEADPQATAAEARR